MGTVSTASQLPRSFPEAQGVPSSAISAFLNAIEEQNIELHSFMLLRHRNVVAEGWWSPYKPELPHTLFSLSKSFTSTAIGIAVSERLLSLDDKVVSFFPDEAPADISPNLAEMKISHLLMMGTGHTFDTTMDMQRSADGNWVRAFLELPVEKTPGSLFLYNTGATYMLAAILQKVSGLTLLEYLEPRLFSPLGIKSPTWESCPRGINVGGYGLSVTTEEIAKFGQLYLQQGMWNNEQILPKEWIAAATSKQIENGNGSPEASSSDWSQGYGYQFWQCRHDAYRADGAFGQLCMVMPQQDAVVAITSGTNNMQRIMDAVWDHLLPAMKSEPETLPDNPAAAALADQLNSLSLNPPEEQRSSELEKVLSGQIYKLEENMYNLETFAIAFSGTEAILTLYGMFGEQTVALGRGKWAASTATILDNTVNLIMSSFTWTQENKLLLTLRFVETAFCITLEIAVEESTIVVSQQFNVSFPPEDQTIILVGHLE
ncbi:serine hydrolase domain-containing protein [Paenibacillus sp. BAC0078]